MHLLQIIAPLSLICTTVWAQPLAPLPGPGVDASLPAATEGAKRRNELKAVLRSNGQQAAGGTAAMDAGQRQQLRRQLREQSSR